MTKSVKKWRCSDELWAFVEPRLPEHKNTHRFGGGRPRVDDRRAFDGILFVMCTGCQWNALKAQQETLLLRGCTIDDIGRFGPQAFERPLRLPGLHPLLVPLTSRELGRET